MKDQPSRHVTDQEALDMHKSGRPGKFEISPTKSVATARDLSLAYTPGVAAPCREIARDPNLAYDYTAKSNVVAVITNGTAVLGLGDIGAQAAKPVMEGKSVLFKKFADLDGIDLEVATKDVDEFINAVKFLGPSFGGINLEDIKAPECFIIEQQLRELMDIPVFHDDQHGTAIISAAALINAADLTGRKIKDIKLVVNGAGAAGIACTELVKHLGVKPENVILCDSRGTIYEGREDGMNQWKSAHAVKTDRRTLAEALEGADAFFGCSVKGAVTKEMVKSMADNPIIFAMANPDPEILPEEVAEVRDDAIMATGRSDYPNQVNNVLGYPYIFRGALDVRATAINEDMKVAAADALAALARKEVPEEVARAVGQNRLTYGADYLIPAPFDPRLIAEIPPAVARAAMESGVAQKPIEDFQAYKDQLSARLDPTAHSLEVIFRKVRDNPRRVAFAEGEEERSISAAYSFLQAGYGTPVLVAREDRARATMKAMKIPQDGIEIANARVSPNTQRYMEYLYDRMQRRGMLQRDAQRLVNTDRNVFTACMVACGDVDAMVTGLTRTPHVALREISQVLEPRHKEPVFGLTILVARNRQTVFIADTMVHERPSPQELAHIAMRSAEKARQLGHTPRVAMLSYATFGNPPGVRTADIHEAMNIMKTLEVDFEVDGEMSVDVALDAELLRTRYPFCKLSAPANVLIMPGLHAANISAKLLQRLGGGTVIGPLLMGLSHSAQIVTWDAPVSDMVNLAAMAAYDAQDKLL